MTNHTPGGATYREIYLQPASFTAVKDAAAELFDTMDAVFAEGNAYEQVIFTGCGTSFYLAQSAAFLFAAHTGIPARAVPCSELYFTPEAYCGTGNTLVAPITRKCTTTEVRMAIDKVRALPSVTTLAITCDPGSAAYNDYMLLSPDAGEESVVMTRSFTSMLYLAALLALHVGGKNAQASRLLAELPALAETCLPRMDAFARRIVEENPALHLYVTLGQGALYGVAAESMNKMKEMGLVASEAYHTLEYRHGPMSLAGKDTLILVLSGSGTGAHDQSLLKQMAGFGAVTAVVGDDVSGVSARYQLSLGLGLEDTGLAPIAGILGQLLGYRIAAAKGLDADCPRNLDPVIIL